jgi:hypothetical protein
MARWSVAGVCLAAAVAIAALASATASAEPEFLTKAVVKEGERIPFSGTIGVEYWEAKSGTKIICESGAITGEVTGPKSVGNVVITGTSCPGLGAGGCQEIRSKVLAGALGGITSTQPGLKLFSEAEGKGGVLFEFFCGGPLKVIIQGEVTGAINGAAGENPETGKLLSTLTFVYAEKAGVQKYQGFSEGLEAGLVGQLVMSIGGGAFEPAGWSVTAKSKTVPTTWGLGVTK